MVNYVLRKTSGLLFTLWAVSIICFLLIQLSPGDKADALLRLQGITIMDDDAGSYEEEYNALRQKLNLDLPWFYVGLKPSYAVQQYPQEWGSRLGVLSDNLLNKKIPWKSVEPYVSLLYSIEKSCNSSRLPDCRRTLSFLKELTEPDRISQRIHLLMESEELKSETEITSHLNRLLLASSDLNQEVGFYYPITVFHGLDNQYHRWMSRILRLDFGTSISDGRPVTTKIFASLKWTLVITLLALFFSLLIGVPLGVAGAIYRGGWGEKMLEMLMNVLYAIPVFWMATLLIVFFTTPEYGRWTNIFPSATFKVTGDAGFWTQLVQNGSMLVVPVICLILSSLAIVVRLTKRSMLSEMTLPYTTSLMARGLSSKNILWRHNLPNAMMPIVTLISNSLPVALAGSLIVEVICNIPGMGRLMYNSIFGYDWDVCFAVLLMISVITSIVFLLSDIIYVKLNPRIRGK